MALKAQDAIQLRFYDTATPRIRPSELEQTYSPFFSSGTIYLTQFFN